MKAKTKLWFTEDGKTVIEAGRAELLRTMRKNTPFGKPARYLESHTNTPG